jgi:acyl carrier protein
MPDALHAKVQEIVRDVCGDDGITLTEATAPRDVEGWDSLAHVNIVYAIEEEFGVEFGDDEIAGFATVGELEDRIRRKRGD